MPRTPRHLLILTTLTIVGCNDHAELARQANEHAARQAEQNREMAKLNQHVAEGTKRLVDADAQMRQDFLQANTELEAERKQIAAQRHRDPIIANTLLDAAILIACVLPIVLAIYVVRNLGQQSADDGLAELLLQELASEEPMLLAHAVASPAIQNHSQPALPDDQHAA
ncbi:MAG TPA: hypothetical protein VGG64_03070 [Pirellulales bacterium]|jgi:hypothetical protein